MELKELIKRLEKLKERGFIQAIRSGPTGIGHLAEIELGLSETNLAIPDIGGRLELKATRRYANTPITLFTFNKAVWKINQKEFLSKYGYIDKNNRLALYSTVYPKIPNLMGFFLISEPSRHLIILRHKNEENINIAEWSIFVIAGKFMTKMDRLILIIADNKLENNIEYFHFNDAYLLENPTPERFLEAFDRNLIMIDLRMHMKLSGGVRNHGTAFRIDEKHLKELYTKQRKLL